ncbi:hypothetical protein FUAX_52560 (plasmid) [Fulvitalea axinellae]|uniref:DUF4249 domain-containing protein n=1 Tax=Fulvitalea axinellae TaxID=1182444 RepID=A0AAU9CLF9_9BACT|nr:hypothetical protein FUAX_52560 [Fulvitalea axinellae]
MVKSIWFRIGLPLVLSLASSCIEKFDTNFDERTPRVVINGIISDQPGETFVSLFYTRDYVTGYAEPFISIDGAVVKVLDSGGDTEFELFYEKDKYVPIHDGDKGIAGGSYILEVILENGDVYQSEIVTIPEYLPNIDKLEPELTKHLEYNERNDNFIIVNKVNLNVDFTSGKRGYLQWEVEGVVEILSLNDPRGFTTGPTCYLKQGITGKKHFFAKNPSEPMVSKKVSAVTDIPFNSDFRWGYGFTLKQYAIEPEAYEYLRKTKLLMESSGSLFDPFPAPIEGNVRKLDDPDKWVLGYIIARKGGKVAHLVTNASRLGKSMKTGCEQAVEDILSGNAPDRNIPSYCFNCLEIEGTTTEKPDYWY